jgi:hypothetical protein
MPAKPNPPPADSANPTKTNICPSARMRPTGRNPLDCFGFHCAGDDLKNFVGAVVVVVDMAVTGMLKHAL